MLYFFIKAIFFEENLEMLFIWMKIQVLLKALGRDIDKKALKFIEKAV